GASDHHQPPRPATGDWTPGEGATTQCRRRSKVWCTCAQASCRATFARISSGRHRHHSVDRGEPHQYGSHTRRNPGGVSHGRRVHGGGNCPGGPKKKRAQGPRGPPGNLHPFSFPPPQNPPPQTPRPDPTTPPLPPPLKTARTLFPP